MNSYTNLIEKEKEMSRDYDLETGYHNGKEFVKLTPKNVAKVEAMIRTDSKYSKAALKDNQEASPFWILEMKKYLEDNNYKGKLSFEKVVENVVRYIDKENTTHLNADTVGRGEMKKRIVHCKDKLIEYLKKPNGTELKLIHILSERTDASKKARCNLSFARKFCHYACLYMFKGLPEQANFSIYDRIVKKALPIYCEFYGLKKLSQMKLSNYDAYRETVDQIIHAFGGKISRNGFDHLVWYFFKGHR